MSVPKRFALLRFFGSLLKVLAWIFLVLSIVGAVGMAIAGSSLTLPLPDALTVDRHGLGPGFKSGFEGLSELAR